MGIFNRKKRTSYLDEIHRQEYLKKKHELARKKAIEDADRRAQRDVYGPSLGSRVASGMYRNVKQAAINEAKARRQVARRIPKSTRVVYIPARRRKKRKPQEAPTSFFDFRV